MAKLALAILVLGCCTCAVWSINDRLREVFSWRQVDFEFPSEQAKQAAVASGEYIQANNMPLGLEVWRDKLFITVPRWKAGVASTLNYVPLGSDSARNGSPALVPYPDFDTNRLPSDRQRSLEGEKIISALRPSVDACDRLWVIDSGSANGVKYSEPQLIVIDLKTDRIVRRFAIGEKLRRAEPMSMFVAVVADADPKACDRAFAYLPDIRWGMLVYSFHDDDAWRLEHAYFYFDPLSTVFNIGGVRVEWLDGLFGMALSKRHSDGYRTLYFQAMASTMMFSVNTRALQSNKTTADMVGEFKYLGERLPGMQANSLAFDEGTGSLLYPLVNRDAVGCWNPSCYDRMTSENTAVVAKDPAALEYPADIKVDRNNTVWLISDKLPKFQYHPKDFNVSDVNFRVMSAPVAELIKETVCQPPKSTHSSHGHHHHKGKHP